jgi:hypothetical protein
LLRFGEKRRSRLVEFFEEQRDAVGAAEAVADGVFDDDFGEDGAVGEFDGEGVGDGALGGVVIVGGELRVFDAGDEGADGVDALAPDGVEGEESS